MFKKEKVIKFNKIAVIGNEKGVGSTYISLLIFLYLKILKKQKVLLCSKDIFISLKRDVFIRRYLYDIKDYVIKSEIESEKFLECKYIVNDFGTKYEIEELKVYDKVVFVTDLSFWKIFSLREILELNKRDIYQDWKFVYTFGEDFIKNSISRKYNLSLFNIPFRKHFLDLDINIYTSIGSILK